MRRRYDVSLRDCCLKIDLSAQEQGVRPTKKAINSKHAACRGRYGRADRRIGEDKLSQKGFFESPEYLDAQKEQRQPLF